MSDPIVEAVRKDLLDRSTTGIAKYGTTLARQDLRLVDWLRHAYEEALDLANYLKRSIVEIESRADGGADIVTRHMNIPGLPETSPGAHILPVDPAGEADIVEVERRLAAFTAPSFDRGIVARLVARIRDFHRRERELLDHNNQLLERARKAERKQRERH